MALLSHLIDNYYMQARDKQGKGQGQAVGGRKDRSETEEAVLSVFADINKVQSASKVQVFELVKLFRGDPQEFSTAFELAYLKIFRIFHERANRKMPPKFEQLAGSLFGELLSDSDGPAGLLFNHFVNFLAEGIFSAILGIRITTARMMFHLVKLALPVLNNDTKGNVLRSVYFLLRLKVSTYKQVGIKLAAQVLGWQHELRDKIELELFKILSAEENEQIRKMALTNLPLSSNNMARVLIRLRDKTADIRSIVLRKLTAERFNLEAMSGCNRLHLLYDGFGNKEASIQQDTLRYLSRTLQGERPDFGAFVLLFRPGVMMAHPQIYALFNSLTCGILEDLPFEQLCNFTKDLTQELKQLGRGNAGRLAFPELIWLKNLGRVERSDARTIFQECVPSGMELARVLLELLKGKDVWSINECLQLFSMQKSADQIGRNKMFDSLKRIVTELDYFEMECDWSGLEHSDICPPITEEVLYQRKLMLSYFDLPLLSNSYDLLHEAGTAMKALWPDHYEIELKQIIADWNNPEENTLFKERELAQANIRKVEAQGDPRILASLRNKLKEIQQQLLAEGLKTRSVVLILSRLRAGVSMEDFMPIIKEDLQKECQEYGLILLALFCLDESARVEKFLSLYWTHITTASEERRKIHLLVSLKATTDFMVKFDLSKLTLPHEFPQKTFTHQRYIRKLLDLAMDPDADIRILTIQALCRLLYHGRVAEELVGAVFMRLLLLWWETSSQEVGAKTVHTISLFMKQYIQRGQGEVRKLSEALCVFFKVMLLEQAAKKSLNKRKIMYNLRYQEFVKRSVVIAMTVLKYHKESRQVIWKYQESGAELGPQELFLLFIFKHDLLHYCLEKALNIVDFYEDAPLETVILMKKEVEILLEETDFGSRKNLEACLRKLEKDLEDRIQIKNQETFNEELLNGLRKELKEYELLINEAAATLAEELQTAQIFTQSLELFGGIKVQNREESEPDEDDVGELIAEIEDVIQIDSESDHTKRQPKGKRNLGRISEGNEEQAMRESDQKPERIEKEKKSRKRQPQPASEEEEPSSSAPPKPVGQTRVTRSNRNRA